MTSSNEKLKVLYINTLCGYGSTGKISEELAQSVVLQGGESLICYGRRNYSGEVPSYKISSEFESKINGAMQRIFDNEGLGLPFSAFRLIKKIKEFQPNIIHLNNLHGNYLNYKILFNFLKTTNIKVVWTLHDCWSFTGHCTHFDCFGCDKWKTQCEHCQNKNCYPKRYGFDNSIKQYKLKRKLFNSLDGSQMVIVSPSKWLDNLVGQSFLKNVKHLLIYNGIDISNFSVVDNHTFDGAIDRSKKIVLAVASAWSLKKGFYDILKISDKLSDEYVIVIAGVDDTLKKEIKNKNVVIVNRTETQAQLAELYSLANVFINPTYEDNFPTVNLEALACGCPVITYKTGGSVEVITDFNGQVIEKGNVNQMIEKIVEVCSKTYDKAKLIEDAKNKFDKKLMIKGYLEVYKAIIR